LSDTTIEEASHEMNLYFSEFGHFDKGSKRLNYENTTIRISRLLEANNLAAQIFANFNAKLIDRGMLPKVRIALDATLKADPNSIKKRVWFIR
jgi:hypothetical protein